MVPAVNIIPGILWGSLRRGALTLSPRGVFSRAHSAPAPWLQATPNLASGEEKGGFAPESVRGTAPGPPSRSLGGDCAVLASRRGEPGPGGGCSPGRQIPAGNRRSNIHFQRLPSGLVPVRYPRGDP